MQGAQSVYGLVPGSPLRRQNRASALARHVSFCVSCQMIYRLGAHKLCIHLMCRAASIHLPCSAEWLAQEAEHGVVPVQGTQKLKLGRPPFSDAGKGSGTRAVGTSFLRSTRKDPNTVRSSQRLPPGPVVRGPGMYTQHGLCRVCEILLGSLQRRLVWLKVAPVLYRYLWRAQRAGWERGL